MLSYVETIDKVVNRDRYYSPRVFAYAAWIENVRFYTKSPVSALLIANGLMFCLHHLTRTKQGFV